MKKLDAFSVPSTPEPVILMLCPWQEGNISPNGDKTHRPGDGSNIEGEGERGRRDSSFLTWAARWGNKMGETRRSFTRGDLNFCGDKFHFGQVEFERLIRCPSRHNQKATRHFHSSYSTFKVPLSEKPLWPQYDFHVSLYPTCIPLKHHHLFFYLPFRL